MWIVRLWTAGRQPADIRPGAKDNELEELRKEIAEKEGAISEIKQRLHAVEGEKNRHLIS
jgi:predicted nuclease with TOPRIM domain